MVDTKEKYVADIVAGETIEAIFVLSDKNMGHKRDGNPYLNVTLIDKSGRIKGVIWDNVDQMADSKSGDFVRIKAHASEYRGMLQLVISRMDVVSPEAVSPDDFLPATARDVDQMYDRLTALTDTITSEPLQALMKAFWSDANLVKLFKRAPAAKMMHHAYIGGLLEHTLSMALLADKIAGHYSGVDRDLLLVGAVLHDMGKIYEFSYAHSIDYTDEGRLLSHIIIGVELANKKIETIDGFPSKLADLIKHMIVSHHGVREYGSTEPPKTIEAVLLNYVDEIDSRVNSIREFMAADDSNSNWTPYHRLLERHFYKGGSDDSV